jgi:hypothetical protein
MTSSAAERSNWTAAGSDASAKKTYDSIKTALAEIVQRRSVDVFLQGSYANSTNIRADSDVDVVVMTRATFQGASERLASTARSEFDALPAATYTAADLRREVTQALTAYYGSDRVHSRNKCVRVDRSPGYVDADVVPCLQYRWFTGPYANVAADYKEGIAIHPLRGGRIVNFPKEHIGNGQVKNAVCGGRYKATVRQVKRLRNRAVDGGWLEEGVAPGYLLECMVFNAPTERFVSDDSERLIAVVLWLKHAAKEAFVSCDRIHHLFKTDPGNFSVVEAQRIVNALWEAL